jgi:hypothetical protein
MNVRQIINSVATQISGAIQDASSEGVICGGAEVEIYLGANNAPSDDPCDSIQSVRLTLYPNIEMAEAAMKARWAKVIPQEVSK